MAITPKRRRGLAGVSPERRKAIARKGAAALHAAGKAHQFTPEEAAAARQKVKKKEQE